MLTEIILFATFFSLGCVSRCWAKGLLFIERKMKNRPGAIVLEFFSVGLLAAAVVLLLFLISDGVFRPFTVLSLAMGFVFASLFV